MDSKNQSAATADIKPETGTNSAFADADRTKALAATIDERGGWTSASAAEADSLCPGRHLAQRGLPEPEQSEDAASGTRIHKAMETGCLNDLSDDEEATCYRCQDIEADLVQRIFEGKATLINREQRLWIDFDGFKHSGKADVVYLSGDVAAIFDYKTGRNEVTESPRNLQMRDLAVLVAVAYNVKQVHVAIIQPWATMTPEVCTYTKADLVLALTEMEQRVLASNNPQSPRIPGEKQCQYCRAKAICQEFKVAATLPTLHVDGLERGIATMGAAALGKFLAIVRLAEETATTEVRRRIEAGEAVDGWTLKPGRESEKITDATTVFNRALAIGIPQHAFVRDCITVGKTALKTALKGATGAKGKELDTKLEELLAGTTETKTSNPVLTKV